jgi:hypothetical protein
MVPQTSAWLGQCIHVSHLGLGYCYGDTYFMQIDTVSLMSCSFTELHTFIHCICGSPGGPDKARLVIGSVLLRAKLSRLLAGTGKQGKPVIDW